MEYSIIARLVDKITGNVIGYEIKGNKNDTVAAVSYEKAKELGVEDLEDVEYLEIEDREVLVHNDRYALCTFSKLFLEEFADTPCERMESGRVCLYGYVFDKLNLLMLDSEHAIKRLSYDKDLV